jgi:tetratricopeptide (TPR) repeat protein
LEINRLTQNTFGVIINLNNLGFLKRHLGRVQEAGRDHRQALEQALRLQAATLALDALIGLGAVLLASGQTDLGMGCFTFAARHPEADRQTEEELADVLRQVGLSPEALEGIPPLATDLAQTMTALVGVGQEK